VVTDRCPSLVLKPARADYHAGLGDAHAACETSAHYYFTSLKWWDGPYQWDSCRALGYLEPRVPIRPRAPLQSVQGSNADACQTFSPCFCLEVLPKARPWKSGDSMRIAVSHSWQEALYWLVHDAFVEGCRSPQHFRFRSLGKLFSAVDDERNLGLLFQISHGISGFGHTQHLERIFARQSPWLYSSPLFPHPFDYQKVVHQTWRAWTSNSRWRKAWALHQENLPRRFPEMIQGQRSDWGNTSLLKLTRTTQTSSSSPVAWSLD